MLISRTQTPQICKDRSQQEGLISPLSKPPNQMDVFATPSGGILRYQYVNNCKYNAMNSTKSHFIAKYNQSNDKQLYN